MLEEMPLKVKTKKSSKIFPDSVSESWNPRSSIVRVDFFKKSMFQLSKKVQVKKFRIDLGNSKFLEVRGYVNVTDQDNFLIVQKYARNNTKEVEIGGIKYNSCVFVPKADVFKLKNYSEKGGGYHQKERNSHERLRSLNIRHNIFPGLDDTIGLFSRVGYDKEKKSYYFCISEEYSKLIQTPKALKSINLPTYFALKLDISKIFFLSFKIYFETKNASKKQNFTMRNILERAGKYDWINKSDNKDYLKPKFRSILFPGFKELKDKGHFRFDIIRGSKYKIDSLWEVERIYDLKRDIKEITV